VIRASAQPASRAAEKLIKTHRNQSVSSAQQQASAARPASEDQSASGSAKAQPGLIGGAA
jgi:hypothetical protein